MSTLPPPVVTQNWEMGSDETPSKPNVPTDSMRIWLWECLLSREGTQMVISSVSEETKLQGKVNRVHTIQKISNFLEKNIMTFLKLRTESIVLCFTNQQIMLIFCFILFYGQLRSKEGKGEKRRKEEKKGETWRLRRKRDI